MLARILDLYQEDIQANYDQKIPYLGDPETLTWRWDIAFATEVEVAEEIREWPRKLLTDEEPRISIVSKIELVPLCTLM